MRNLLFCFLLFIISANSFSQNDDEYQYVGSAKDGTKVYILFEKENYGMKEFWIKMINPVKTVKNKKGKLIKSGGGYTLEFCEMNCSAKTFSTSNGIKYNKNGDVAQRLYDDTYNERVIPGTIMDAIHNYICKTE